MLLLLACAAPVEDSAPADLAATLVAPGPWQVGHRDDTVTYEDPAGASRELHLSVWYPTEDTDGDNARYFLNSIEAEGIWQDASIAGGPFPALVFSHGHQGYAENSSFLMEHLASHGFVVAAPDHTGNTTLDGSERTTEIYYQRPADVSAVLDWLEGSEFGLTGERVGLGHSFGGYTMLALGGAAYDAAALDCPDPTDPFCVTMTQDARALFEGGFFEPRLSSIVVMAAGDFDKFGAAGIGAISLPVFDETASEDQGEEAETLYSAITTEKLHLVLEGGGHQSFTDFSDSMEDVPMDADTSWRIVDAYTLAWVRHALGDTTVDPVLDGAVEIDPAAALSR